MDDNILISISVLTAIWDEEHKDNIELIMPFIIDIIFNNYKIGDSIDEETIINQLRNKFCFSKFPHAILKVILNRMRKRKFLKLDNKKFYLIKDFSKDSESFRNRLSVAKNDTAKVIKAIKKYLSVELNKEITEQETERYFSVFVSTYGYNAYENINYIKGINRKAEVANYLIGEFICKEYENKSEIFELILKIIKGYMIANAIYLQINNDNKSSLKKLNCYLDSPFILRVLGYKSDEENQSAKELYDLLLKYGATIKCFEHTYAEVKNILVYYKNHINQNKDATLEYFDKENYSEGQVELVIDNLEDSFKSKSIYIEPTPDISDKSKYKDVIDENSLEEKLKQYKEQWHTYYNPQAVTNDVISVNAINVLRKGKITSKIENCTHILVTTYNYLKIASKEVMPELSDTDIGLVIDDLDLTTILWLKDFENNSDLPKLRLIENALAATNASDEILMKATKIYESIKKDNIIKNIDNVSNRLTKNYLKASGFIATIKNDPDLVTKENMVQFLSNSDKKREEAEAQLEKNKIENEQREKEIQKKFLDEVDEKAKKYDKYENISVIVYNCLCIIVLIIFLTISIYINIKSSEHSAIVIALMILSIASVIDAFAPRFRKVRGLIGKFFKNKKRDYIAKETDNILNKYR